MYEADLELLRSPSTGLPLQLADVRETAADGEILEATLADTAGGHEFPIRNGIPRFVGGTGYNETWDFKWRTLDGGRGLNYRIIDKADPAYQIHDLFDRNGYDGAVYRRATGKLAIDVGCGIGQYSVRLAREYAPKKLVAVDLTGGVDIFRAILAARYPELMKKILIVQGNIFELPFAKEQFDFVMSLGVLMHTGDTKRALSAIFDLLKPGGTVNFWIYASEPIAYDAGEKDRGHVYDMQNFKALQTKYKRVLFWLKLFRRIPHERSLRILKFMSSDYMYKLIQRPRFRFIQNWFSTVEHPDEAYRLINNYDGYVNLWADSWSESEIFPVLKEHDIMIRDLAGWRLGVWGVKQPGFYGKRSGLSEHVNFVSYPKTGNTWARLVLGSYFQLSIGTDFEFLLEGDQEENCVLSSYSLPTFYASHAPLTWEAQTAADLTSENVVRPFIGGKVILMVRYPLDAILSFFMQHHRGRGHEQRKKFTSFLEFATDPVFGIDKAIKFYNIWSEVLEHPNVFPLQYEALRGDTLSKLTSLLQFLEVPVHEPALREAIQLRSFENMKKLEVTGNVPVYRTSGLKIFATGDLNDPNSYFVREGKFRGYREHLDDASRERLERQVRAELSPKYGYD